MLNKYPIWKYLLLVAIIVPGFFYALPNLYGDDPGLQIRGARGSVVDTALMERVSNLVASAGLDTKSESLDPEGIKIRFGNAEDQLKAREIVQQELKDRYTVALSLLPATPPWMKSLNASPMYLGLDLRGGVHFLMEVDMDKARTDAEDRMVDELRSELRQQKIRHSGIRRRAGGGLEARFPDADLRDQARDFIERSFQGVEVESGDREGSYWLDVGLNEQEQRSIADFALQQNITSLRNRIDELGVAEPIVQRQGENRIVIQLPGVQDSARAREILGKTATLEMKMVDEDHDLQGALGGNVPAGSKVYRQRDGQPILLQKRTIYAGDNIIDAAASIDNQTGSPIVSITLDDRGAAINQRITGENIGRRMAVVYIETRSDPVLDDQGRPVIDGDGDVVRVSRRIEEVITAPVIRDQLGKRFQIEGLDSVQEARDLALLLRAGALAAPVDIIEERTVGPTLGQENIRQGMRSVMIGFALVFIFMIIYYRLFGAVANVALFVNLVLIVAVLSLFQATLTLPGIAGIVLTVGMAVDANVLIFERIREELRNGNSPQASIHAGYDKALSTIIDANITTLIAAIVLFNFGTGPIKGFAITLSIGILTSMFTAIVGTRGIINLVYGGKRLTKLAI